MEHPDLDADIVELLEQAVREHKVSFKQALNDAVRAGLARGPATEAYRLRTFDLGVPSVPVTKALQLAADLEDDELIRRFETGR